MMKLKIWIVTVFIVCAVPLMAQELIPFDEEFQLPAGERKSLVFTWGGNLAPVMVGDIREDRHLFTESTSLVLWMNLTLPGDGILFIRGRDTLTVRLHEKAYPSEELDNKFDLDVAFYEYRPEDSGLNLYAGRKIYSLGSGIILAGRGDGIELNHVSPLVEIKAFSMYSGLLRKDYNPYGLGGPDFSDGAKRLFSGMSLGKVLGNQNISLLGLYQKDFADEENGGSTYDSWYGGAGIKGFIARADYFVEGYYQGGKSHTDAGEEKPIHAFGAAASLNYYFTGNMAPSVSVQYGMASGDEDRTSAASSTGNTDGDDRGFITFGYFPAGLALRPSFSNIHIFRAGGALNPFGGTAGRLKKMTIAAKYSFYMKFDKKGVISSGEAVLPYGDVGHGMDANVQWAPFSDLVFYAMYGLFIRGRAYTDDEPLRHFVMIGTNLSF